MRSFAAYMSMIICTVSTETIQRYNSSPSIHDRQNGSSSIYTAVKKRSDFPFYILGSHRQINNSSGAKLHKNAVNFAAFKSGKIIFVQVMIVDVYDVYQMNLDFQESFKRIEFQKKHIQKFPQNYFNAASLQPQCNSPAKCYVMILCYQVNRITLYLC